MKERKDSRILDGKKASVEVDEELAAFLVRSGRSHHNVTEDHGAAGNSLETATPSSAKTDKGRCLTYVETAPVFRSAPQFVLYKMIGDEEGGVVEYFDESRRRRESGPATGGAAGLSDWAGAYFQLNAHHCLGTLGYRWDQGYRTARMVRATFGPGVPISVVRDEFMADPALTGREKALRVRRSLGLSTSGAGPLMEQLDGFLLCRESEDEWEMVCKLGDVSRFLVEETVVCEFRQTGAFRQTACRFFPGRETGEEGEDEEEIGVGEPPWQRFDDAREEFVQRHFGRNEVPGWAQRMISLTPSPTPSL